MKCNLFFGKKNADPLSGDFIKTYKFGIKIINKIVILVTSNQIEIDTEDIVPNFFFYINSIYSTSKKPENPHCFIIDQNVPILELILPHEIIIEHNDFFYKGNVFVFQCIQ